MPVYSIQYAVPKETGLQREQTEWVCPRGYQSKDARRTFRQQFPSAAVGSIIKTDS